MNEQNINVFIPKQYNVLLRSPLNDTESVFRNRHDAMFGRLRDINFDSASLRYEYALFWRVTGTYRRFMRDNGYTEELLLHDENGDVLLFYKCPLLNFLHPEAEQYIVRFLSTHAIGLHYRTNPFPQPVDGILIDEPVYHAGYNVASVERAVEVSSPQQYQDASSAIWSKVASRCGFDIVVNGSSSFDYCTNYGIQSAVNASTACMIEVALEYGKTDKHFESMIDTIPQDTLKFFGLIGGNAAWARSVVDYYITNVQNVFWMHRLAYNYRDARPIYSWGHNPLL